MKAIGYVNMVELDHSRDDQTEVYVELKCPYHGGEGGYLTEFSFNMIGTTYQEAIRYTKLGSRVAITIEVLDG